MKKFGIILLTLFVVATSALLIVSYSYIKRAPQLLSESLSHKMKCPVHVGALHFSLHCITIEDFTIDNPNDSILPQAFHAACITIDIRLKNLFEKNLFIRHIAVHNIALGLEFDDAKGIRGNWTRLMENFYTEIDDANAAEAARTLYIETLDFQKITTQLVYKNNSGHIHTLPTIDQIQLTGISSEGGLPIDQIANSVLGEMLLTVFKRENLHNMLQDLLNPKNTVKRLISPFKILLP